MCDNLPSDLNIDANGCHFNVPKLSGPVTISIRFTSPTVLSIISMGSRTNVDIFTVELFDDQGQLITSNDGSYAEYMSTIIDGKPTITDIEDVLITSISIKLLNTINGRTPTSVTLSLAACFPFLVNSNEVNVCVITFCSDFCSHLSK